jgi:hypothetical protein
LRRRKINREDRAMGDIGQPVRKIEFLPAEEPAVAPIPVQTPEREREPVPA